MSKKPRKEVKPVNEWVCETCKTGMTLRDYFAAAALNGMLSNTETARRIIELDFTIEQQAEILSKNAYMAANAMLAAREKGQK